MLGSVRFRPPQLAVSKELEWVLGRAFGARAMRLFCPGPHMAVVLSRALDLGPRIALRNSRAALDQELGAAEARALVAALGATILSSETLLRTTREVAEAAAELGVTIVVLKGMALHLTGRTPIGARGASDVDVLVSDADLPAIAGALERRGFRADRGGPPCEHQLPGLQRGPGENVDVHRFVPGVCLPGHRGFADVTGLERCGLLDPLPALAGRSFAPALPVLAAHALVHGIAQHGFAPQSYPLMRMVCDLVDLGVGRPSAAAMWAAATTLAHGYVDAAETAATWELCERLSAGAPVPSVLRGDTITADTLLAHILASAQDTAYRDSLRLRVFGSAPSLLPRPVAWLRDVARSLWPSDAHLRALSAGRPRLFGLVGARLGRPVTQARRAARACWSAARIRRRASATGVESRERLP
jgi:Uncharacterised nucleotidyltransferase